MNTRDVLEAFKKEIKKIYGDRLKQIILYGSYARGDATEDSDIDLLIVLEGKVKPGVEIDRMIDVLTEMNLKYGVLISVYPASKEDFKKVNSPLFINVRREGIVV
ncbi:nucleotidyltransferase domain-containing protein [Candidatus Sumerlaeota bacterium]|nr:nucleotidyltransferase domain-containing protein [Candidatus Sumerlaeota bacterium]